MSVAGVLGLFRTTPHHPVDAEGRMSLADHLRELRARILRSVVVLVAAFVVALFFYDQLLDLIMRPYNQAREALGQEVQSRAYVQGIGGPLLLQLKLAGVAAIVATSPYWLYQIWAFTLPGLHPHERRWTRVFVAIAGPLFVAGVATGYYVLPKGIEVLIGFTNADMENLVDIGSYVSFFTRMLLVFGVSYMIPLFVVMLSLVGVVSGRTLGHYRAWIVLGVFVFAAVATPSTDPFSMLMLATPMTVLFLVSEVVARLIDRSRGTRAYDELPDDVASPLDPIDRHREDVGRSELGEEDD